MAKSKKFKRGFTPLEILWGKPISKRERVGFLTGFTLIELLVVISIIGILASVVLVSFPGATKKAKDSRIISAVSQARVVMVYINANDSDYDDFYCTTNCSSCTNSDLMPLCQEVTGQGGTPNFIKNAASNSTAACLYSLLTAKTSYWYCADSTGKAAFTIINPSGAGYCVANTSAVCPAVSG